VAKQITQPWWAVIGPDEGESLWQPLPSRGHVTLKLTPESMPPDTFTTGIQVLPPGCHVREHGHQQNHELIFIHRGTGRVTIEDESHDVEPGSMVLFGRYARHVIENTGDEDMQLFWVFMPPGLEHWFRAIGRQREPGTPMPEAFDRPDNVEEVMEQMRFVPPAGR
jgi:oxalate decarboxylase/phosphoglucose isomerase-like protein (cupin superfamily)